MIGYSYLSYGDGWDGMKGNKVGGRKSLDVSTRLGLDKELEIRPSFF